MLATYDTEVPGAVERLGLTRSQSQQSGPSPAGGTTSAGSNELVPASRCDPANVRAVNVDRLELLS
jgi:hypothetical protein